MEIITSDKLGLLKKITWKKGSEKAENIETLEFKSSNPFNSITALNSGLENFVTTGANLSLFKNGECTWSELLPNVLSVYGNEEQLITCTKDGSVSVRRCKDYTPTSAEPFTFETAKKDSCDLECAAFNVFATSKIAVGGKESDLDVYDFATGSRLWTAKNIKNNFLDQRQPIWITKIAFADQNCSIFDSENTIVTATKYGQVRLYDMRIANRPQKDISINSTALTALTFQGNTCIVGDAHGKCSVVDLKNGRTVGDFKGHSGGISAVQIIDSDVVLTASLDRNLRIFDAKSRQLLCQTYLKSPLTDFIAVPSASAKDESGDELWDGIKDADDSNDDSDVEDNSEECAKEATESEFDDEEDEVSDE